MSKYLSIKADDDEIEIHTSISDYVQALGKRLGTLADVLTKAGLLGSEAPLVASVLGDVISIGIPSQKLEQVILFLKVFADRLKYLEEDLAIQRLKTKEFADLFEDALGQAARALSDERREYIANLLKNSLTDKTLDHLAKKRLLAELNGLNDAQIILLFYYSLSDESEREEMRAKYPFVPRMSTRAAARIPDPSDDKEIVYRNYQSGINHLLLLPGENYVLSGFATLLLRYIGLRAPPA
jgi:hypothetical protein